MIRSKSISDYFEASFDTIKAGKVLTFDVHLYFQANAHVIVFLRNGESPSAEVLNKYRNRHLKQIWIHKSDVAAFRAYHAAPVEPAVVPTAPLPPPPVAAKQTHEGAFITAVMDSKELTKDQKQVVVAKAAQNALAEATTAKNAKEQGARDKKMKQMVQDILESTAEHLESVAAEIWGAAEGDAHLQHGITTATYAVVLSMAFGRIDKALVADLAFAALIHDVGLTQVPVQCIPLISKGFSPPQDNPYRLHVQYSNELIKDFHPKTNPRVFTIVGQHHEKFDGSGYPQNLKGFKVDDIAQILALADMLSKFSTGLWDGQPRTLREAFDEIEKMEKVRTFPEFFNPEVLATIMKWFRNKFNENDLNQATEVVEVQARDVLQNKAA